MILLDTPYENYVKTLNTNPEPTHRKIRHPSFIKFSLDGDYAPAKTCFPLQGKAATKREWIKGKRLYVATIDKQTRVLSLSFMLEGKKFVSYFMDCITGTLYHARTAECLSSHYLKAENLTKHPGAAELLMSWTVAEVKPDAEEEE